MVARYKNMLLLKEIKENICIVYQEITLKNKQKMEIFAKVCSFTNFILKF